MIDKASFKTIRTTLHKYIDAYTHSDNIKFVTIGFKEAGGVRLDTLSIRFYVKDKLRNPQEAVLPRHFRAVSPDGEELDYEIKTDVVGLGEEVEALGLQGGNSIEEWTSGTIAFTFLSNSGVTLLLTNHHVVSSYNQFQRNHTVYARRNGNRVNVGTLYRTLRLRTQEANLFDASVVRIDQNIPSSLLSIQNENNPIIGYGQFRTQDNFEYFYLSGNDKVRCSSPEKVTTPIEIKYKKDGVSLWFKDVWKLRVTSGQAIHGHSGSVIVRYGQVNGKKGLLACGLLFAGTPQHIFVTPIKATLQKLSSPEASLDNVYEDLLVQGA